MTDYLLLGHALYEIFKNSYKYILNNFIQFSKHPKDLLFAKRANEDLDQISWILHDDYKQLQSTYDDTLILNMIVGKYNLPEIEQMQQSLEAQYDLKQYKAAAMIFNQNTDKFVVVQPYLRSDECIDKQNKYVNLPGGKIEIKDINNLEHKRNQNFNLELPKLLELLLYMDDDTQINALIREIYEETSLNITKDMIIGQINFTVGKCRKPREGFPRGETITTLYFIKYQKLEMQELKPMTKKEIKKVSLYNYPDDFIKQSFGEKSAWAWNLQEINDKLKQII
ncbi:NUDIX_hydrolase-like domain superfamily [Hexamita inflata]|uniref:NUDIX hydrolase-like domain superfamily n=1 Tax=Hexamita inflata TaxID=28002 RepID=A0AA86P2A0_9EUKA|nr:NUDIX hydrolase-like domain superfamily [Hexamita inflata]